MSDERHMRRALELARTALELGELPIAAVLVSGDRVVEEAHNRVAGDRNLLAHAEFRVLSAAAPSICNLKRAARQEHCVYVTLEPCMMCFGLIMNLNLGRLVYGLESPGDGVMEIVQKWEKKSEQLSFYKAPETTPGFMRDEAAALFREFADRNPKSPFAQWTRQLGNLVRFLK